MNGIEAEIVAKEMISRINKWLEDGKSYDDVIKLTLERLEQIRKAGESGWY